MKFECIDAKQEFEDILKPFEATEIKSIDEFTDEDGIYYSANIIMSDDTISNIDKLIKDNGAQFIDNGEYMFDTKYGYCDISDDGDQFTIECFVPIECCEQIDESMIPVEESSDPKLGKKIKQLKGWKIYQGTDSNGYELFRCFTPDEDRPMIGYEDWECETLDQAISWIENYDLDENYIPITENDEVDASPVYNTIVSIGTIDGGMDEYHINIIKNDDFYDVDINDSLCLQEPISVHDNWTKNDFKLLALNTFVDFYKEIIFKNVD